VLPLQAFLSGLGSKLAEDIYQELKDVVGRVLRRSNPRGQERTLVLQDTATGLQVVLEPRSADRSVPEIGDARRLITPWWTRAL
jgi:hypothetical protein